MEEKQLVAGDPSERTNRRERTTMQLEDLYDFIKTFAEATEMGFARVDARFDAFESRVEERFDRVETRVARLETRVESVEDGLRAVRGDIAALARRSR